ncbi:GumC family protein [Aurantiacibacter gilvus]|uniref:Polysaccharide biosynthesis tyrosine autokinase n=1 Tax=Aurantiacibacter gilvus TaxID=3139141 RepID=A0ABU9IG43_9SPHN
MQSGPDLSTVPGDPSHGYGAQQVVGPTRLLLRRLRTRAWRLKYLLFLLTLGCLLGFVAAAHLQGPQYSATARIEIDPLGAGTPDGSPPGEAEQARDRQYFQTQYELLQSGFIAERVAGAENAAADAAFRRALDLRASDPSPRVLAGRIADTIAIEPVPGSTLVDIVATTPVPEVSSRIANAWAAQFLETNLEKRFGNNRDARDRLASQLATQREALEASETRLAEFASENGIVVLEAQSDEAMGQQAGAETLSTTQLATLNEALIAATLRRVRARSALDAKPAGNEIDRLADLRSRRAEAANRLAELRGTLGDANPRVQALEAEIESLDRAIESDNGGENPASDLQAAYEDALRQENQLREQLDALRDGFVDGQGSVTEYGILRREVDSNRELYEALLQRQAEVSASAAGTNNMRMVAPAVPPSAPSGLTMERAVSLALVVAAILSLATVGLAERLDRRLRDARQVQRHLGLSVVGEIPQDESGDLRSALRQPRSYLATAYAAARDGALSALPDHARRVLLLTSAAAGEGKSASALGLALAHCEAGGKAILLDLDIGNRGASQLLGIPARTGGMGDFLAGRTAEPPIMHLADHGIDFIPAGSVPAESAGLTTRGGLARLIADLDRRYDLVVIDSPPVLDQPEVEEIAYLSGGVLFVVRADATSAYAAREALALLGQPGVNLLGALVAMTKD